MSGSLQWEKRKTRGGKLSFKSAYLLTKLSVTKEQGRLLNAGLLYLKTMYVLQIALQYSLF